MDKIKKLIVNVHDLPLQVEVVGRKGIKKIYEIRAGSRDFGASMCKVDEPIKA